jgi:hypothetical protein
MMFPTSFHFISTTAFHFVCISVCTHFGDFLAKNSRSFHIPSARVILILFTVSISLPIIINMNDSLLVVQQLARTEEQLRLLVLPTSETFINRHGLAGATGIVD